MKRFLSILLVFLALCAICAMGVSAAGKFDPDTIQRCMLLNDTEPVNGKGHCGVVLVDKNGYMRLYTFQQGGLWKQSNTPAQLKQFLKDGRIPRTPSQFQFDRILAFNITPEEGRRMYDYAETTEFGEFYMNASFWKPVGLKRNTDNCTTFAQGMLAAGSRKYKYYYPFGVPNYTFTTLRWRLGLRSIPYTIYYTEFEGVIPTTTSAAS